MKSWVTVHYNNLYNNVALNNYRIHPQLHNDKHRQSALVSACIFMLMGLSNFIVKQNLDLLIDKNTMVQTLDA